MSICRTIGWKFYLCFIIPGTIGSVIMWIWFPDTKGKPLEEVAAIFGDVGMFLSFSCCSLVTLVANELLTR